MPGAAQVGEGEITFVFAVVTERDVYTPPAPLSLGAFEKIVIEYTTQSRVAFQGLVNSCSS